MGVSANFSGSKDLFPSLPTRGNPGLPFFILQIIKTWIKKKAEFLPPPSSVYSPVLKTKWILHSSDSLTSNLIWFYPGQLEIRRLDVKLGN